MCVLNNQEETICVSCFRIVMRVALSDKTMYYFYVESLISLFCMTCYYISFVLMLS